MKRSLTIGTILALTALFIYACSSTIRTADTSFVTITIGEGSGATTLHAEKATFWARMKYLAADIELLPKAYAYIPSVVQVIVVTVSAPYMTAIVAVDTVANKTSSSIRIEVPNGPDRKFLVEGLYGLPTQTTYRGSAVASLDGREITLLIKMQFVGTAIYVDAINGDDLKTGLDSTNALKTITRALSLQSTFAAYTAIPLIVVAEGSYLVGGGEVFPLQLNPGTKLLCTGMNHSTVMDDAGSMGNSVKSVIIGQQGSVIEGCTIDSLNPYYDAAVDDGGLDMTITNCNLISSGMTTIRRKGVIFSGNSTLKDSLVKDFYLGDGVGAGVAINGGNAFVTRNTISGNEYGIKITAGNPTIDGNTVVGSIINGIYLQGGTALINNNLIESNHTGIMVSFVSPTITNNTIRSNSWSGITVSGSAGTLPVITGNSLSCNVNVDLEASGDAFNARGNSWDHAPPTVETLLQTPCSAGADICYSGVAPLADTWMATVPGGCP